MCYSILGKLFVVLVCSTLLVCRVQSEEGQQVVRLGEGGKAVSSSQVEFASDVMAWDKGAKTVEALLKEYILLWGIAESNPVLAFETGLSSSTFLSPNDSEGLFHIFLHAVVMQPKESLLLFRSKAESLPSPLFWSIVELIRDSEILVESETDEWLSEVISNFLVSHVENARLPYTSAVRCNMLRKIVDDAVLRNSWREVKGMANHWARLDCVSFIEWANNRRRSLSDTRIIDEIRNIEERYFKVFLENLKASPRSWERGLITRGMYLKLIDLDMDKALKLVNLVGYGFAAKDLCDKLLGEKGRSEELFEVWEGLSQERFRKFLGKAAVSYLANRNPKAADELFKKLVDSGATNDELLAIGSGFGDANGRFAVEAGLHIEDVEVRGLYSKCAGYFWGGSDPIEASKWVTEQINGGNLDFVNVLDEARSHALFFDSDAVFDSISRISDEGTRRREELKFIRKMSGIDPYLTSVELTKVLDNTGKKGREDFYDVSIKVVSDLIKRSPSEAKKWVSKLDEGSIRDDAVLLVIENVVTNDGGVGADELLSLIDGREALVNAKNIIRSSAVPD